MFSYIKEFVHGDFGRTKPNLGELLNSETDILQLDVKVGGDIAESKTTLAVYVG